MRQLTDQRARRSESLRLTAYGLCAPTQELLAAGSYVVALRPSSQLGRAGRVPSPGPGQEPGPGKTPPNQDKKEWLGLPRGCDCVLFVQLPRQSHGGVAAPLVPSPSSCCASICPPKLKLIVATGRGKQKTTRTVARHRLASVYNVAYTLKKKLLKGADRLFDADTLETAALA
jgi:hypothetical protein